MGLLIPGHVPRCPGGIGPDRDVVPASLKSEGHVTYDLCILPEAPHKPHECTEQSQIATALTPMP